jgi:diguanylate cyclase (GGDEF)-like protein
MVEKVRAVMRRHRLTGGRQHYAVMFLDFDRFKLINDTMGHEAGDQLLKSIACRLGKVLRSNDTAARFGGDEFVVLLEGLASPEEAVAIVERVVEACKLPHDLGGVQVTSTASVGMVASDLAYSKAEDVLRDADLAMYRAKLRGKACWVRFEAEMHAAAADRLKMETELREAIERKTLTLAFQPIVQLGDRRVVGFETLCRWTHAQRGVVRPDQFIELAEDSGLIVPLGTWVLGEAARHAKALASLAGPGFTLTVNVSKRQLQSPDAAEILCSAAGSPDNARLITLEITESVIMDDRMHLGGVLQQLRDYGFSIAMDDFGTGHSSLANLHRLPLDIIKIDRAFVREVYATDHFEGIMQSILLLARHLRREVVVEGIENEAQVEALARLGVKLGQGFLFARPMDFEQAMTQLARPRDPQSLVG